MRAAVSAVLALAVVVAVPAAVDRTIELAAAGPTPSSQRAQSERDPGERDPGERDQSERDPGERPRTGSEFYVDPTTPAARQVEEWQKAGRTADAELVSRIAEQPQPEWVTTDAGEAADYVERAEAAGGRPLLVAYNIPGRDCGSFSAGGAGGADDYAEWVDELAAGIAGSAPLIVLEPDAIPQQITGCAGDDGRYDLLADAVATLTDAGADVYLDAGHPRYVPDVDVIADALERAGVADAAGFALNVSNFAPTDENIAYGTAISERLGGAHFVVDTSRNGADDPPAVDSGPAWCNPPDRELGEEPTTDTGNPLVDALLWIKRPGESDGACRGDEPQAGGWYPDYALDLVD